MTTRLKRFHDFLKDYEDGKWKLFEDRRIDIYNLGNILSHKITVGKRKDYYNFEDSEQIVEDFLNNGKIKLKPSVRFIIKCPFSIENM